MAIPTNISTLLAGNVVEWARIEFKKDWNPDSILKTICAFANDVDNWGGGYIIIGVEEKDGRPIEPLQGVDPDRIDGILKDMLERCRLIQPLYMPVVEVVDWQEKKFIVIWAPGGSTRPYSCPKAIAKDARERGYYIRKMSSTFQARGEELKDLFSLVNNVPFDDQINHGGELVDLKLDLICSFLRDAGSSLYAEARQLGLKTVAESMNLVSPLPEYQKPKNVALMFFSFDPERFFPYARIEVVEFSEDGTSPTSERTFTGPLDQQLRSALLYIRNTIIEERVVKLDDRAEALRYYNYPYAAIEEALCNAVYHKGYDVREPIEVRIEHDCIIVVSYPGADRSVTIEGLKSGRVYCRRYRNRRIGEFLKELHLTEGRNTGLRKIYFAMSHNGSPSPRFEMDEDRTYFATVLPIHPAFLGGVKTEKDESVDEALYSLVKGEGRLSMQEMASRLSVSVSTVERAMARLKDNDMVVREGGRKYGHWRVK